MVAQLQAWWFELAEDQARQQDCRMRRIDARQRPASPQRSYSPQRGRDRRDGRMSRSPSRSPARQRSASPQRQRSASPQRRYQQYQREQSLSPTRHEEGWDLFMQAIQSNQHAYPTKFYRRSQSPQRRASRSPVRRGVETAQAFLRPTASPLRRPEPRSRSASPVRQAPLVKTRTVPRDVPATMAQVYAGKAARTCAHPDRVYDSEDSGTTTASDRETHIRQWHSDSPSRVRAMQHCRALTNQACTRRPEGASRSRSVSPSRSASPSKRELLGGGRLHVQPRSGLTSEGHLAPERPRRIYVQPSLARWTAQAYNVASNPSYSSPLGRMRQWESRTSPERAREPPPVERHPNKELLGIAAKVPRVEKPLSIEGRRILGDLEREMRLCLEDHADPNCKDPSGMSPLHFVAKGAHDGSVSLLLRSRADAAKTNFYGELPVCIAVKQLNGPKHLWLGEAVFYELLDSLEESRPMVRTERLKAELEGSVRTLCRLAEQEEHEREGDWLADAAERLKDWWLGDGAPDASARLLMAQQIESLRSGRTQAPPWSPGGEPTSGRPGCKHACGRDPANLCRWEEQPSSPPKRAVDVLPKRKRPPPPAIPGKDKDKACPFRGAKDPAPAPTFDGTRPAIDHSKVTVFHLDTEVNEAFSERVWQMYRRQCVENVARLKYLLEHSPKSKLEIQRIYADLEGIAQCVISCGDPLRSIAASSTIHPKCMGCGKDVPTARSCGLENNRGRVCYSCLIHNFDYNTLMRRAYGELHGQQGSASIRNDLAVLLRMTAVEVQENREAARRPRKPSEDAVSVEEPRTLRQRQIMRQKLKNLPSGDDMQAKKAEKTPKKVAAAPRSVISAAKSDKSEDEGEDKVDPKDLVPFDRNGSPFRPKPRKKSPDKRKPDGHDEERAQEDEETQEWAVIKQMLEVPNVSEACKITPPPEPVNEPLGRQSGGIMGRRSAGLPQASAAPPADGVPARRSQVDPAALAAVRQSVAPGDAATLLRQRASFLPLDQAAKSPAASPRASPRPSPRPGE